VDTAAGLVVLGVVLVLVTRPARGVPEAAVAVPGALLLVALRVESVSAGWSAVRHLLPTLAFLAAIFVVAEAADAAGLFEAAGTAIARLGGASEERVLLAVAAAAVLVTTVLSLDATAVLFTPVVVAVVKVRNAPDAPLLATVQLANGASLLLPVSNLTNLLVLSATGLDFAGFAARMLMPEVVAAAVIVLACRRLVSRAPALPGTLHDPAAAVTGDGPGLDGIGRGVAGGLAVLLIGFFATSLAHVGPAWVAAVGAVGLGGAVVAGRRASVGRLARSTSPLFLLFVAALGVVVDGAARHGVGRAVGRLVPHGASLPALVGLALLAAVLANLCNNLPATLLLLAVVPHATGPMLAVLVGVNIGPNLTYSGSLATLLWRKVARASALEPGIGQFYRVAAATPFAVVGATVSLWAGLRLLG
jgi:arsenical pump membrane protein